MKYVVFGAGACSVRIEYQSIQLGFKILCYIDNDQSKWYKKRLGLEILPPQEVLEKNYDRILIASEKHHEKMTEQLVALGIKRENILIFSHLKREDLQGGRCLNYRHDNFEAKTQTLDSWIETFELGDVISDDYSHVTMETKSHNSLISDLLKAYELAKENAKDVSAPYQTGQNWEQFLKNTRPEFYRSLKENKSNLAPLLANFFRNDLSTGIFGGKQGFDDYVKHPDMSAGFRSLFNIWAYSLGEAPIKELDSPKVGNPYGHLIDDSLVHPNNFLNHYRGRYISQLVGELARPVIAEIGAGYGGLAYYLKKFSQSCCYINFDLPENLLISSYYLSIIYPELKTHYYTGEEDLRDLIAEFDIVLLPHFCLPQLPDLSIDCFINTISLSEMSFETINEYLEQIQRTTKRYFYHENLINNGQAYTYYPIDCFPELKDFQLLARQPSRWPFFSAASHEHCHVEQLFLRKNASAI